MACGYDVRVSGAGAAYGPPPTVWWSTPAGWPEPCVSSQLLPSSSVKDSSLVTKLSCDENVRFVPPKCPSSVKRMGSKLTRAKSDRWSSQNAVAGVTESLKVTRSVWFPASMKVLPVLQSTPIDGSPAACSAAVVDPNEGWMQPGGVLGAVQSSGAG